MSNATTIAIIGVAGSRGLSIAKRFAAKHQVLLFDKDQDKLAKACHQILVHNSSARAEVMVCPADASWEADVIMVTGYCSTDTEISTKISKVSTGKIVIVFADDASNDLFINPAATWQQLLPHSKVIAVFTAGPAVAKGLPKEIIMEGNDEEALITGAAIFTSAGFNTQILFTPFIH